MARERFRVCAKDAHFNGEECFLTHPADSEESLRALIAENAPNLTIVRIDPLEQALRRELYEAKSNVRILPEVAELIASENLFDFEERVKRANGWARRDVIKTRLDDCCALAELLGSDAQENLAQVLRRFGKDHRFALDGLDTCPFSFSFRFGEGFRYFGGLIFHASSKTWSTHT